MLATDVDDRFLEGDEHHLEFRLHDIARSRCHPISTTSRTRGVLEHIGERERALATMVSATKPGGYVVIEDPDWVVFDAQPLPDAFGALHYKLRGTLHRHVRLRPEPRAPAAGACSTRPGLVDVDAEGRVFTMYGGDAVDGVVHPRSRTRRCLRSCRPESSSTLAGTGARRGARPGVPLAVPAADDRVGPQASLTRFGQSGHP